MAIAGLGAAPLAASEPERDELLRQLEELRAKVERLEANQRSAVDRLDAAEVDATVDSVFRDAETRSQFLQLNGNFTAGYINGEFVIQDEAGDFVLHPWLQFQPRWALNHREDFEEGDDDTQSGFEIRRMKLGFDGNAFGKNLTYLFLWATDRNSGSVLLEEAWARYAFATQFAVRGGQFKNPFAHESLVSSKRLLAPDRTLLTNSFTGGDNFVQGISLTWDDGPNGSPLRAEVAYTDGANAANQNFQDFPTNEANFGVSGRVEYLVFGKWGQYDDFSALGNENDLLVIGAGVDLTEAGNNNVFLHTIDAQYETGRLGLYGAYYGRANENAPVGAGALASDENLYDWGLIAQASYALKDRWEPYARYSFIHFDGAGLPEVSENQVHEITGGVTYYIHGHNVKFTLDLTWLPNGTPITDTGANILVNDGNDEVVLRAQFQLLL